MTKDEAAFAAMALFGWSYRDRMLIHVDDGENDKERKAKLSPALLDLLRDNWLEARPEEWMFPGKHTIMALSPCQLNKAFASAKNMAGIYKPATLHASHFAPQLRHAPT